MTIFKVHFYAYVIGGADFLHSFFSTVACRLEGGAWGSRYSSIMNSLYQGGTRARSRAVRAVRACGDTEKAERLSAEGCRLGY